MTFPRIQPRPGVASTVANHATTDVRRPETSFRDHVTRARGVDPPTAVRPLDQLRAGTIDRAAYIDMKLQEATAHLSGLAPWQRDAIERMLRDKLECDPALVALMADIQRATV